MKRLADIFEIVLLVLMIGMCVVVLMAGSGRVPYFFGYRVMQVISNSMRPTISEETCIVIKRMDDAGEIKVGDVITFMSEDPRIEGFYNTHRVYDIVEDAQSGEIMFQTKGDAYETPDALLVSFEQIAGKYVGELPFGRYLYKGIIFLTNRVNYFIVVIAPLFLCLMSYMKQLLVAIFKRADDYEDESDEEEDSEEEKKDPLLKQLEEEAKALVEAEIKEEEAKALAESKKATWKKRRLKKEAK